MLKLILILTIWVTKEYKWNLKISFFHDISVLSCPKKRQTYNYWIYVPMTPNTLCYILPRLCHCLKAWKRKAVQRQPTQDSTSSASAMPTQSSSKKRSYSSSSRSGGFPLGSSPTDSPNTSISLITGWPGTDLNSN